MIKLQEKTKENVNYKISIEGEALAGKTTWVKNNFLNPLFLSTDGNAVRQGLKSIDANTINFNNLKELADFIIKGKYTCLCIDTADEFEQTINEFVEKITGHKKLTFDDWGMVKSLTNKFIDWCVKAPIDVVFIVRTFFDGKQTNYPMTTKYADRLFGRLDCRLEITKNHTASKLTDARFSDIEKLLNKK
ncbi:MAG: ATP-binding protein [Endomicrobium sp.]|jgi:hypothetical protein|nr:ATP-binding protein [Endomicrobium sp.]